MDASLTLWIVIAVVVCALVVGVVAMTRRAGREPAARPETPGDGMATKRPGLPGEPD